MKIINSTGREDLAIVHIAQAAGGNYVEFVESLYPPKSREEKWILTLSTLYGCPVSCTICDAGPFYLGRISKEGMFWQLDYMLSKRYPDGCIPVKKLKVHFTRMGEPAFNMSVLEVIEEFDLYFNAPGFMPSISSIAPKGSEKFFKELLRIKNEKFSGGKFQLQFSIHTTDIKKRDELIPVKKWSFNEIAAYGDKFFREGERKITLSFAPSNEYIIDPNKIAAIFDPQKFIIKLTPLNTTSSTVKNNLTSLISPLNTEGIESLASEFRNNGYEVIISIGSYEELKIGSTCGQNLVTNLQNEMKD
ncbi:MAG: radical SAM protein [Ignavibacteria bacterium]|nr:radical SAM protein [Ignavibacteria bacterium]